FETGLRLFKEQLYDAALVEFERSYALGRRPTALRNIAQCHRELRHFVEAHDAFARLLRDHTEELKAPERKDVERAIADLALVTATVAIKTSEPSAQLSIDGRPVGASPLAAPVRVPVGTHKIRATKPGFAPAETELLLVGMQEGAVELALRAEVLAGRLSVRVPDAREGVEAPPAMHVIVDDKDVGVAPWEGDLPPGAHAVEGKGEGVEAPRRTVEIVNGQRAEVLLDARPTTARLRLTVSPANAEVTLNGRRLADGAWEAELAKGKHTLVASAPGFKTFTRTFEVQPGDSLAQDVSLVPDAKPVAAAAAPEASRANPYTGILSIFSTLIRQGQSINIFEDGLESRDFVYIDDVVEATFLAATVPAAAGAGDTDGHP
ncbi:PEGA domain-containing protein, partial [bacterium]